VFPGIHLTKSDKASPLWGEEKFRGSGPSTRPSGKVFAWLLLRREFSNANFYTSENLLTRWAEVNYYVLIGMVCCVVRSGTRQFNTPLERASWYVLKGAICSLCEATSGSAASIAPHRSLDLQRWAIPPYFCLIRQAQVRHGTVGAGPKEGYKNDPRAGAPLL